jgi:hypothetical protein
LSYGICPLLHFKLTVAESGYKCPLAFRDEAISLFKRPNLSSRINTTGSDEPLTEMGTGIILSVKGVRL